MRGQPPARGADGSVVDWQDGPQRKGWHTIRGMNGHQHGTAREQLEVLASLGLARLPPSAKRLIAGPPIRRDGLELDLDTQVWLKLRQRYRPRPPLATLGPERARADLRRAARLAAGRPAALAQVRDTEVAGADGSLPARLYVPGEALTGGHYALLVYYHGGGWVTGDLDTHDAPCRFLAQAAGIRLLSVAYRLAPEHPFPAPVDDALAAFRDAAARAGEFGADPARVAVGGDSAGGHLAAVVAQMAAADGGPAPAFQLLVYPVTDSAVTHASRLTFADGFLLTKPDMDWYEAQFLDPQADRRDPRISPLHAADVTGVAPALVVTAGFDPLRDEGEAYAEKLAAAGIPSAKRRHPGYVHGFFNAVGIAAGSRQALAEMGGALRVALARPA